MTGPKDVPCTFGEEEDPEWSFFTVEAIIWGVLATHQTIAWAKLFIDLEVV